MASIKPLPEPHDSQDVDEITHSLDNLNHRAQRTLISYLQDLPSSQSPSLEASGVSIIQRGTAELNLTAQDKRLNGDDGSEPEADKSDMSQQDVDDAETVEEDEGPKTIMIERPRSRPKLVFMGQRR